MSSSTPEDSDLPGSVSPDTDASYDEEIMPLHDEANNDGKNVSITTSLMEEHALPGTDIELDSVPTIPEVQ